MKKIKLNQKKVSISDENLCFHLQKEKDKSHCVFWNFTIKYVEGVIYFVLSLSLLKRIFTTFWASFFPERHPVGSPFETLKSLE